MPPARNNAALAVQNRWERFAVVFTLTLASSSKRALASTMLHSAPRTPDLDSCAERRKREARVLRHATFAARPSRKAHAPVL